jgi:uncharacterized membrane protein YhiD involved in acid resistance
MYKHKFKIVILIGVTLLLSFGYSPMIDYLAFPGVLAEELEQNSDANSPSVPSQAQNDSFITRIFGSQEDSLLTQESWPARAIRALISFSLAALLAAALAFRPRKNLSFFQRNPYVAQTQILLSAVGAALMIVVADNAARAFGIFAAASIIRFRTNIRDPKEITVLLVSLAIGIASGIGRWEISIALTLFMILILWPLERFEFNHLYRAMELKVKTHNLSETDTALKKILKRHRIDAELRKLDPEDDEDPHGVILYYMNLNPGISLDQLSGEIFSSDSTHIESIQWQQKKSNSYAYR